MRSKRKQSSDLASQKLKKNIRKWAGLHPNQFITYLGENVKLEPVQWCVQSSDPTASSSIFIAGLKETAEALESA